MSFRQKMDDHIGLFVSGIILATLAATYPLVNMFLLTPKNEEIGRLKDNVNEERNQINTLNQELEQLKKQLERKSGPVSSETSKSQTPQEKTPDSNTAVTPSNKEIDNPPAGNPAISRFAGLKRLRIGSSESMFISKGSVKEYYFDGIANTPVGYTSPKGQTGFNVQIMIEGEDGKPLGDLIVIQDKGDYFMFSFTPPESGKYKFVITGQDGSGVFKLNMINPG